MPVLGRKANRNSQSSLKAPGPAALNQKTARNPGKPKRPAQGRVTEAYAKLSLSFEANRGQTDPQVKFFSRGQGYALFLTSDEAVLRLKKPVARRDQSSALGSSNLQTRYSKLARGQWGRTTDRRPLTTTVDRFLPSLIKGPDSEIADLKSPALGTQELAPAVLRMKLVGANPSPRIKGLEELPGKSSYFLGKDPNKWRTNVSDYAKVSYEDVYPGIGLVYYGNPARSGELEYDFVVAPGADPKAIKLAIQGASQIGR